MSFVKHIPLLRFEIDKLILLEKQPSIVVIETMRIANELFCDNDFGSDIHTHTTHYVKHIVYTHFGYAKIE